MSTTVNLNDDNVSVNSTKDGIVIVNAFAEIRGGRSLNTTGFSPAVIQAGHVIIMETATKDYKPMPLNGSSTAYAGLPADHEYAGVLRASILTKKPFAGILTQGTVNPAAAPFPMTSILSAVKAALPLINFRED
ncbi:hypothetical protein [Pedobacter agri]|uniref:hypothetical protein n=1 Tax=Pedobacter agri TaxID=454586 RepID=UPI00292FD793|nr:hypothetical protein [Pedobacter agri]